MRRYVPRVLLWLFVVNLGTAFGAGIYESRVVVPQWQNTLERSVTFSYFIPTILRLTATEDLPEAEVQATLSQWLLLDYGRHALTLAAWLAALKALSLPGERGS